MKVSEIKKKINDLSCSVNGAQNEEYSRQDAQLIFLQIHESPFLTKSEKEMQFNNLRIAVRPLSDFDYTCERPVCEINSFLSELCLAASFYLLESEKRIRLSEAADDIYAGINKRAFENRFFSIVSSLLKLNDEIGVEIKSDFYYCSVVISAESFDESLIENPPENSFAVYTDGLYSLALKIKPSELLPDETDAEDFSLLLSDTLSPLHIWLCDI